MCLCCLTAAEGKVDWDTLGKIVTGHILGEVAIESMYIYISYACMLGKCLVI